MIEIDLFYNVVVAAIRDRQADYLKRQRSVPFKQDLPEVVEMEAEAYAKMRFFQRLAYRRYLRKQYRQRRKAMKRQKFPVDELLTRGYNAGIEMALRVLDGEFKAYMKELKKEDTKI